MRPGVLSFVLAVSLTGCGVLKQAPPQDLPALGQVSSVTVRSGSKIISNVTQAQKVAEIVAFVDSHRTNWQSPWYGIPVPKVTAEFFKGKEFKGSFGAGDSFFETQREGSFFSQRGSVSEIRHFLDVLNVDGERAR